MFYVYEWYVIKTGEIFYVGKGTRNRYKVKNRNKKFNEKISKEPCDVRIIKYFESEEESFKYEEERINELKSINQCSCNLKYGGNGGVAEIWTEEMRQRMSEFNPMKDEEQKERMSINNPMKNKEISKIVGEKHKRKIVINGIVFDGTVDASRKLGVATNTILNWCKRGYDTDYNPCRYFDEEQKPFTIKKTNSIPVIIDDKRFNSVKEASLYYNCWSESIIRAIKGNRKFKGMECRYDNQQPS